MTAIFQHQLTSTMELNYDDSESIKDEIEIEDHHLLEHPQVRQLYPDMDISEIENEIGEEFVIKEELIEYDLNIDDLRKGCQVSTISLDLDDDGLFIIREDDVQFPDSKCILEEDYEQFCFLRLLCDRASVSLKDSNAYLNHSERFCKDCLILFPSKNDLNNHKRNKRACTDRTPSINSDKNELITKSVTSKRKTTKTEVLKQRISFVLDYLKQNYVNAASDTYMCSRCKMHFKKNSFLKMHLNMQCCESLSGETLYYRCLICSCYYRTFKMISIHLDEMHHYKISNGKEFEYTKTPFKSYCYFCPSVSQTKSRYNKHMAMYHRELYTLDYSIRDNRHLLQISDKITVNSPHIDIKNCTQCFICGCAYRIYAHMKYHFKVNHKYMLHDNDSEQRKIPLWPFFVSKCKQRHRTPKLENLHEYNAHIIHFHKKLYRFDYKYYDIYVKNRNVIM